MTEIAIDAPVDTVDTVPPAPRLCAFGLQHVLVMYAGAVAVPLIVGRALKLAPEDVALLISADLFGCGIVTLIQSLGVGAWFGIRLPVMMGVTFAAVGPMVAMANAHAGRGRRARDLRRASSARASSASSSRPLVSRHAALLSAGRHRHDHPDHRRQPDADRHRLDLRPAAGPTAPKSSIPRSAGWLEVGRLAAEAAAAPPRREARRPSAAQPAYAAPRTSPSRRSCWSSSC